MAIAEYDGMDGVTVGASELSVISQTTTLQTVTDDGVYQFWVDASAMQKADSYIVKIYEKVRSGSTKRVCFSQTLLGAQVEPLLTPTMVLLHGWDFTIQKLAGTDRAFDASVRRIS